MASAGADFRSNFQRRFATWTPKVCKITAQNYQQEPKSPLYDILTALGFRQSLRRKLGHSGVEAWASDLSEAFSCPLSPCLLTTWRKINASFKSEAGKLEHDRPPTAKKSQDISINHFFRACCVYVYTCVCVFIQIYSQVRKSKRFPVLWRLHGGKFWISQGERRPPGDLAYPWIK